MVILLTYLPENILSDLFCISSKLTSSSLNSTCKNALLQFAKLSEMPENS